MEFNPHKGIVSYIPPAFFLKGCYAYSHSMYGWANPPFKKTIPQLPAVYESPASPEQGFSIASFSGYICFDGAGCEKEKNRWEKEQLKR